MTLHFYFIDPDFSETESVSQNASDLKSVQFQQSTLEPVCEHAADGQTLQVTSSTDIPEDEKPSTSEA